MRKATVRATRGVARLLLIAAMLATTVVMATPNQANALAAWQLTVVRVDPSPQLTGATMLFRIQAQCSAIDENVCRDTEIRWPADAYNTFTASTHPVVESLTHDAVADEWVLDLADRINAGTTLEIGITATVPNHLTPDQTPATIDATITSSNTASASASASGAWSASADLVIDKYGQFGLGQDMILDQPVRYYLNPCDPNFVTLDTPGHLYPVDLTIVDTLPTGVVYVGASAGGSYDGGANTVTWNVPGPLPTDACDVSPTPYWVDVTFPSTVFGAGAVPPQLTAQNDASITGYPLGAVQDATTLLSDADSIVHGFTVPSPSGSLSKYASTPHYGWEPITFAGDMAWYYTRMSAGSGHTASSYFELVDRLPCLTNDRVDADVSTVPNHYDSLSSGICTEPAFQPDHSITVRFYAGVGEFIEWPDAASRVAWVTANPELPVQYETTLGATGSVNLDLSSTTTSANPSWTIDGATLAADLGLAAGEQIASITVDSRDFGLRMAPGAFGTMMYLNLMGAMAEDTPAYPMGDQTRVWNTSTLDLYDSIAGPSSWFGSASDEVVIVPPSPTFRPNKFDSTSPSGRFELEGYIEGTPLQPGEQIVMTDLLPPGYEFQAIRSLGYRLFDTVDLANSTAGEWDLYGFNATFPPWTRNDTNIPELAGLNAMDYIDFEVIDDYAGTGRQLVRATYDEPPIPGGWQIADPRGASSVTMSIFVTPTALEIPATNTLQMFPTDPITIANFTCSTGATPSPALIADPFDLDGDGATTDTYCEESETIPGSPGTLFLNAVKSVQGDNDVAMRPFPAIGNIGTTGGTATFEISLTNVGVVGVNGLTIYDVLPHVGDTALTEALAGTARGSEWEATFAGLDPATVPSGTRVEYSASNTPCRDELATPAGTFPAGCVNDWSTSLPAGGVSAVRALRFTFVDDSAGLLALDPAESISIQYDVTYPAGLAPGDVAWNSFAYAGRRIDDGLPFLPAEPPKVGLAVPQVDLIVSKSAGASTVAVNTPVTYTIEIDHEGAVTPAGDYTLPASTAYNVTLVDDGPSQGLVIDPASVNFTHSNGTTANGSFDPATGIITLDEIGPNDTFELTYDAWMTTDASITNGVQVDSTPGVTDIDSTPGNDDLAEDDHDSDRVVWGTPGLSLSKQVESASGSGVFIDADASDGLTGTYGIYEPVTYRFVVENTGTLRINSIELTDPLIGFECDQTVGTLFPGQTSTIDCTWPYGYDLGSTINTATVTGVPITGGTVSASDTAEVDVVAEFDLSLVVTPSSGQLDHIPFTDTSVSFDVTVRNQGDIAPDAPVVIAHYVPAGFSIDVAATQAAAAGIANVTITATGEIQISALGATETVTVPVILTSDDPGTTGTVENMKDLGVTSIVYGAEIQTDGAPAGYTDRDSTPDGVDTDVIYDGPDSHNDIGHLGAAYDDAAEDEDDHDREEITVAPSVAHVGNFVWNDLDGDGEQDVGEPGIENVIVTLDPGTPGDTSDDVTTTTDADGLYEFRNLDPGTYTVSFTQPAGTSLSPTGVGATTTDSNGLSTTVTLAAGDDDQSIDLGVYTPASVGDFVWEDLDGDGVQGAGEPGIENVTVTLDPGTPGDTSDDVTTTTDATGAYSFTGLVAGTYTVTFTQPAGTSLSPTGVGATTTDSNGLSTTVTLASGDDDDSIDLGVFTPASVGDFVWDDLDGDGVQGAGEPGIENVTVTLDPGTPGDTSDDVTTTTDATGAYSFTGLAPGEYTVTFTQPAATVLSPTGAGTAATDSDGLSTTVTLASGDDDDTIDLGVYTPASVGDFVWNDLDADGVQDAGEPGVENVTVTLDPGTPGDTSDDVTTTTDATGAYSFTGLAPGEYTVTFTQPAGTSLSPTGAGTAASDSNGLSTTVTLASGDDDDTIDLGIYTLASIGDFVWDDLDGDGVQDAGEPGIENVTVTLDPGTPGDTSDDVTTTTDASGAYSFTGLAPGDYTVTFTPPAGMALSPTGAGSAAADSNGASTTVTLVSGQNDDSIDLGLYTPASVGDFVWDDLDGDGVQGAGEPGIENVTVTLDPGTPGDTSDDVTTTTDATGAYSFTGLAPGEYTVTFTQPAGTALSPTGAGTAATDSDGLSTTVTLTSGDDDDTIDLGVYTPASVGDFVWDDLDADGVQDAGEPGIENVVVTLDPGSPGDTSDDVTTTTDATGAYSFTGLAPGEYTVTFTQPAATALSPTGAGTAASDSNGLSTTVTLASGDDDDTIDLGVYASASIGDFVWDDLDGDGVQDAGEPGIENVAVTLDPGTPGDTSDDVTTLTDSAGAYSFTGLTPGDYAVTFTPPAGMALSPTGAGSAVADSNGASTTVTLVSGQNDDSIDLGLYTPASVGDFVWDDLDGDGVQDAGEPGIENVTVTLDPGTPGDTSDDVTTTTDATGAYSFTGLAPGDYTVTFAAPAGMVASPTGAGTSTTDSNGLSTTVTLASGDDDDTIDLGLYTPAAVGDFVWDDLNGDGVQDAGEPGVENVTVTLDPGTPGDTSDDVTTLTDSAGAYSFTGLAPGDYTVTFTQPAGTALSPTGAGTAATDSNGLSTTVTLASGDDDDTIDLAVYIPASLGDFVWDDLDGDGVQDAGEPGIENVTVTLDPGTPGDTSDDVTTLTDSAGAYSFTGLVAGDYTVSITLPASSIHSPTGQGTTDVDSDGPAVTVTLVSGDNDPTLDFGIVYLARVGDFVWDDLDADGVQDAGEPGIENVTVTLDPGTPGDTSDDLTTTTDATGWYEFADVDPGVHTITFTPPAGWLASPTGAAADDIDSDGTTTSVDLAPGESDTTIDAGFYRLASIGDFVWDDLDGDGVQDAGEPGIENVTVTLDPGTPGDTSDDVTTTTDATGAYSFTDLEPGPYTVSFDLPTSAVASPTGAGTPATDTDGTTVSTVLDSGENDDTIDLGVYWPVSIGDFVWDDLNGDGVQDAGETGISGVTVTLDPGTPGDPGDDITQVTDAAGGYDFSSLAPGTYTVTFTPPPGTVLSPTGAGTTATDSNGLSTTVTLNSGDTDPTIDLGVFVPAQISGQVWHDADVDGVQAVGESGVETVVVILDPGTPGDTSDDLTTNTDASGAYSFTGLAPGDYTVTFTQPAGSTLTRTGQGTDATNNDGLVTSVTLDSGDDVTDIDLGIVELASISGLVFHDQDLGQTHTGAEPGIDGVTLTLVGTDVFGASVTRTATTDSTGAYTFGDLVPGTYTVTETQPAGWLSNGQVVGSNGGTAAPDSISAVVVAAGEAATGYDFGEVLAGSIAGTVFVDNEIDGDFVGTEPVLAGVEITLAGTDTLGNAINVTTTTGADGSYLFANVPPGTYSVTETQPAAYLDGIATSAGSEGGVFGSNAITGIALGSGVHATRYDFGEIESSPLLSLAKTALPDPGQPGANVSYALAWANAGNVPVHGAEITEVVPSGATFVENGHPWTCSTGDPAGTICTLALGDLVVGDSGTVVFDVLIELPLANPTQTELPNTATLAGVAQEPDAQTPVTTSSSANPQVESTHVSGVVYLVTESGDVPLAGATVALADEFGVPIINPATGLAWETVVGGDGSYLFSGLAAGNYTIIETTPVGYGDRAGHVGTVAVAVPLGGATQDFWHTTSSVAGRVFADLDANGVEDGTDRALSGVTISLEGTDVTGAPVSLTTVTDVDGDYRFDGLLEGTYTITESQPSLWANGSTAAGDLGGSTSGTDDTVAAIAVGAGVTGTGYDFGEVGTTVSGSVFIDGSGTPIAGVTVTLEGTDVFGAAHSVTAVTDAAGNYEFTNVVPGSYVVTETQPNGFAQGIVNPGDEVSISVAATPIENVDFSERAGSITGSVTESIDGTGTPAVGDPAIEGVVVELTGTDVNGTPVSLTTTTDAAGSYAFVDLVAGTYTVTESQPAGYDNGLTLVGSIGGTTAGDDDAVVDIVLAAGDDGVQYDFTEITHPISGSVYVVNTGDPIAGVELVLLDSNGDEVATTTTDGAGNYAFPNVVGGEYRVVERQPNGYDSATPDEIAVSHGTAPTEGIDFGETSATVSGSVFVDGSLEPLAGVTITLSGVDVNGDEVTRTTTTDAAGNYVFEGLLAGSYTIIEHQPDDYVSGVVVPNNMIPINLAAGEDSQGHDFSEVLATSSISGRVFEQNTDDPIPGTTVDLYDGSGSLVATTQTGPDGSYRFAGLPAGTYVVVEHQPGGYVSGSVNPLDEVTISLGDDDHVVEVDFSEQVPVSPTFFAPPADDSSSGTGGGVGGDDEDRPPSALAHADPPAAPQLAFTGAETPGLAALGVGLVAAGALMVAAANRRREDDAG